MPVVRKLVADPLINFTEGHLGRRRTGDRRRDQVRVAVRRLRVQAPGSAHRRRLTAADTSRVDVRQRSTPPDGHQLGASSPADETAQSSCFHVQPTQPVHLSQTAFERVGRTVDVVGSHDEQNVTLATARLDANR